MNLSFRIGSIPVHVHGTFLLSVLLLGYTGAGGLPALLQWTVVVFVGVLMHELGHALVGRAFGLTPQIDLIGFGGLTSWREPQRLGALRHIAISLAGPFVGLAVGAATIVLRRSHGLPGLPTSGGPGAPPFETITGLVVLVNGIWGLLNLLPILPMDGGNVLRESLNLFTKGKGEVPARIVSLVIAVGLGLAMFTSKHLGLGGFSFPVLLCAMFAAQNVQGLRALSAAGSLEEKEAPLREVLAAGRRALDGGDGDAGLRAAKDVLARSVDPALRADAIRVLAYAYLLSGAWGPLMDLLESPAAGAIGDGDLAKYERAAQELGRPEEAGRIASIRSRWTGPRAPEPQ